MVQQVGSLYPPLFYRRRLPSTGCWQLFIHSVLNIDLTVGSEWEDIFILRLQCTHSLQPMSCFGKSIFFHWNIPMYTTSCPFRSMYVLFHIESAFHNLAWLSPFTKPIPPSLKIKLSDVAFSLLCLHFLLWERRPPCRWSYVHISEGKLTSLGVTCGRHIGSYSHCSIYWLE